MGGPLSGRCGVAAVARAGRFIREIRPACCNARTHLHPPAYPARGDSVLTLHAELPTMPHPRMLIVRDAIPVLPQ